MWIAVAAVTVVAVGAIGAAGCRRGAESPLGDLPAGVRRESLNVLLVTLDTTRADRIGVYGRPLGDLPPKLRSSTGSPGRGHYSSTLRR